MSVALKARRDQIGAIVLVLAAASWGLGAWMVAAPSSVAVPPQPSGFM